MSVPLDRLYHYVQNIAEQVYGECVLIYRFAPHGSKKIEDIRPIGLASKSVEYSIRPQIYCYDQEPLNYDSYQKSTFNDAANFYQEKYHGELKIFHGYNIRVFPWNIYDKCLLLHSEQNSLNVTQYADSHFIPVYYWSHAVIALDWFRYAKFVNIDPAPTQKQFLIYNRAWAGTREYRLKFTELLQQNNLANDCQTSFNPVDPEHNVHYVDHVFKNPKFKSDIDASALPTTSAPSTSSADFSIDDYANTKFEVVLETLFDDSRIQLTEKILRPIACGHPFLLVSTPESLQYLRSYGFKTFDGILNESYDDEPNPVKRLNLIIREMKTITCWSAQEQATNWSKIKEITEYNKRHFFSDAFFELVIGELKSNLKSAFTELENTNTSITYLEKRVACYKLPEMDQAEKTRSLRANLQAETTILQTARRYYSRQTKKANLM
jgi:hypothetical protein